MSACPQPRAGSAGSRGRGFGAPGRAGPPPGRRFSALLKSAPEGLAGARGSPCHPAPGTDGRAALCNPGKLVPRKGGPRGSGSAGTDPGTGPRGKAWCWSREAHASGRATRLLTAAPWQRHLLPPAGCAPGHPAGSFPTPGSAGTIAAPGAATKLCLLRWERSLTAWPRHGLSHRLAWPRAVPHAACPHFPANKCFWHWDREQTAPLGTVCPDTG